MQDGDHRLQLHAVRAVRWGADTVAAARTLTILGARIGAPSHPLERTTQGVGESRKSAVGILLAGTPKVLDRLTCDEVFANRAVVFTTNAGE